MRYLIFFLLVVFVAIPAAAQPKTEAVVVEGANGAVTIHAEIAETPSERATGLMFRESLRPDRGMLFDFKRDQQVAMWMKNTLISLDMVFIDRTGRVVNIIENVEPLTETTRESHGPVRAVLELAAGTAARIGLRPGDQIRHRMFQQ